MKNFQVYWIRHAPVAESGQYIGHTDIPALIPPAPANLAMPLPENALWFASPLLRCIDTAHWLMESANKIDVPLHTAPELMEQNFGIWEGKTYDEVWQLADKSESWGSPSTIKPNDGESFIGVCARVDHWLEQQITNSFGAPLIIVAHAGTIRAGLRHALNINPEPALSFCVDYGSVTLTEYFPNDNSARVVYVNR
jgi:alpha-ribazole phosphatase